MPISGIGNRGSHNHGCHAYTLLEVLAVITILGIVLVVLAAPNLTLGEEKAAVQSIGKLIVSDLNLARSEAKLYHSEITVKIENNGYLFNLGETEINRRFDRFGFRFQIRDNTQPEPSAAGGENVTQAQILITPDGLNSDDTLEWKTDHFKGTLQITKDGLTVWKYDRI